MTIEESTGDSAGEASGDTSYAFIGAVHRLLDSERAASKRDLLLAACCQALRDGDLSVEEVQERVLAIWPASNATPEAIDAALDLGMELRLTATGVALDEGNLWTLTKEGVEDATRHEKWLGEVRERALREVVARARSGLQIDVTREEAQLWLAVVLRALVTGIQTSQAAYLGEVEMIVEGRLLPKGIDPNVVLNAIPEAVSDPAIGDFVQGLALSALDPLDPFGSELVSHITTGCVLHGYIAGRDTAAVLSHIGVASNERAILDTPILLQLIGPMRLRDEAQTTLNAAVEQGWEVVVAEHSLHEMLDLLQREIPKIQQTFSDAVESNAKREWYAALDEDQLPALCVEVLKDGTYQRLEQMVVSAQNLAGALTDLGVIVRPHGNDNDEAHVVRCRNALEKTLAARNNHRSAAVVERDTNSMAMAWRRRRRQSGSKWPGAWIITTDRSISPAYLSCQMQDRVSLTLGLPQWTSLLSVSAEPAAVVALARAAAGQMVEEAMWLIPARFPAKVALDLARQLSPEHGGSATDLRVAQLTLDEAFSKGDNGVPSANQMAAAVLSRRTRRINDLQEQRREDLVKQADSAHEKRMRAQSEVAEVRASNATKTQRIGQLEGRNNEQAGELAWMKTQRKRILVVAGLLAAGIGVFVWALVSSHDPATWVSGVGTGLTLAIGMRWCTDKSSTWYGLLVSGLIEAVGLSLAIYDFVRTP